MEKEFVPYELAVKLKALGFNEPCFGYYYTLNGKDWKFAEKSEYYRLDDEINIGYKFSLLTPTFSQAFRWFREKYELPNWVYTSNNKEFWYSILKDGRMIVRDYSAFNSYEEAELACLEKLIEITKK